MRCKDSKLKTKIFMSLLEDHRLRQDHCFTVEQRAIDLTVTEHLT